MQTSTAEIQSTNQTGISIEPKQEEPLVKDNPMTNPFEKAVCLALSFTSFGVRRKADTSKIETKADKDFIRVSKLLLDSPELKKITQMEGEVMDFIRRRCLPSLLRRGIYLVPSGYVVKLNDALKKFQEKQKVLVQEFLEVYLSQKEAAASKLGDQYNPLDYPSKEVMEKKFSMRWNFLKFGTPVDELEELDPEIAREEQQKLVARMQEAGEELIYMMRAEALKKISHLVERLTDKEDGKKKSFQKGTIENLEEFLDFFEVRNITGDESLSKLIKRAKEAMSGVDVDALRSNDALREAVRTQLNSVNDSINKLIETTPRRSISFDEDED